MKPANREGRLSPSQLRRPSEQERILKQYDVAMAEVLLRRDQDPPDLDYLQLGFDGSLQARSYSYSPAMIDAIGVGRGRVPKGCSNKGCHDDGGAPWASVPKALEPKIVSVAGADYVERPPVKEVPEDLDGAGTTGLLQKVRREKEQRVRRQEHNRQLLEQIEAERKKVDESLAAKEAEEQQKLGALGDTVKCYNHKGMARRALSAPIPGDSDEEDQELVMRRRRAVVREEKPIAGTMGLRIPVPRRSRTTTPGCDGATDDGAGPESVVDIDITTDARAPQRPSAFWYPQDRQRLKHRALEEQRLAQQQQALLQSGWAQSTDIGGAAKKIGGQHVLAGLPPDRREQIEKQAQEFLAAKEQRDRDARTRYNTLVAKPRPSELRGTVPVTTAPFAHEEVAPLREQVRDDAREAVDVAAASATPAPGAESATTHPEGRVYVRPFMFERPPPFKPLPVYRPELPAARPPEELVRMELPMDEQTKALQGKRGAAPPWGRETADDAKWAKVHAAKPAVVKEPKPLSKKEVTKEMRLIRDKGLMKKPRRAAASTMTPAQQQFIRSIPSTGPLAMQAMQQASRLPKSTLS